MNTLTDTKTLSTEQLADIADAIGYTLEQVQELTTSHHNFNNGWNGFFEVGNYYVFTSQEQAENYAREMLDNQIEDYFCEVPEWAMQFVDTEKFIDSVINNDGAGFVIATYDNDETETQGGMFVYRVD